MDQDLETLLNSVEPKLRDEVLRMFAQVKGSVTVAEVEALISAGRIQEAMDKVIPTSETFSAAWIKAYITTAAATGEWLSGEVGVQLVFDQVNQRAVNAMQNNSLRLVQNLSTAQRDAVRESILDGIRNGVNPRQAAIAVRDSIGLTARQYRAVSAYRRALENGDSSALTRALRDKRFDRTVASAIRRDVPLSEAQVNKMVDAYIQRQIKYRAEVIARTEALRSVHEGSEEMIQQAIDSGAITAEELVRTWNTARDSRVRDTHTTMEGQQRTLGDPFISGAGNPLRFPGDPTAPAREVIQCRCVLTNTIKIQAPAGVSISSKIR